MSCDCSVTCLFIVQNQKTKQNKIDIKLETLDKRKEKLLVFKAVMINASRIQHGEGQRV